MQRQAGQSSSAAQTGSPSGRAEAHEEATSIWEWVAAALGALLIASAVGYMLYYGLTHPEGPPRIALEQLSVVPTDGGYLVRFRAKNEGNSTAAGLLVGGELKENGSTVEESEATLDYVPQQSEREGGLVFTRDPERYELQLRVKGHAKP